MQYKSILNYEKLKIYIDDENYFVNLPLLIDFTRKLNEIELISFLTNIKNCLEIENMENPKIIINSLKVSYYNNLPHFLFNILKNFIFILIFIFSYCLNYVNKKMTEFYLFYNKISLEF